MPTPFRPWHPEQLLLLPPDLRDWLPPGHLAHHVSDLVDALDLSAFYAPYEPLMMVKVLIYAYATGVFSSRGMARMLEEDVAFRVHGSRNLPRHRTMCEFRRRHLEEFEGLFMEGVWVARERGAVRFGTLSVAGTKVRANARKRKAMRYGRVLQEEVRVKEEIQRRLDKAGAVDWEEDEGHGEQIRGDELPAQLQRREQRLKTIEEAKAQSHFTTPQGQIVKTATEGFQQCDNAHTVVDEARQTIVATEAQAQASDPGQMLPLRDEVSDRFGVEADLVAWEERGIDGHVALAREGKAQAAVAAQVRPATHRRGEKLVGDEGRAQYARRQWLSEGANGWLKEVLEFRRFRVRGVQKVRSEWHRVCLALNLNRMRGLAAC